MINKKVLVYLLFGSVIFYLDRISKIMALKWCMEKPYTVTSFLSGEIAINRGIMSGLFHSGNDLIFFFVSLLITCFTLLFILYAYKSYQEGQSIIGQVCIIFGSCSNIVDRIFYGGVIDFISLSYDGYSWPVFNIADIAIVVGVGIMVMQEVLHD